MNQPDPVAAHDVVEPTEAEWDAIIDAIPRWEDVHAALRAYGQRVVTDASRAVNAHDALVAALRGVVEAYDDDQVPSLEAAIADARTALALAGAP